MLQNYGGTNIVYLAFRPNAPLLNMRNRFRNIRASFRGTFILFFCKTERTRKVSLLTNGESRKVRDVFHYVSHYTYRRIVRAQTRRRY